MASTLTTVQFMDPPGGPGVTGAVKAGSGISISADGTISTQQGGGIVKTIVGTNGVVTTGTTDVIVSLNPPVGETIGGVRTVEGSGIAIDSQGIIRSVAQYNILAGTGITVSNVTPISSTVSVNPAGVTPSTRGAVWIDAGSGLAVELNGSLALAPATVNYLGGIRVGAGLEITPDGILSTAGGTGTITEVVAGIGLSGGGSAGSVTLNLDPANVGLLGGIKVGSGLSITPDGTLSVSVPAGVASVTGQDPINIIGTPSNPVVTIDPASITQAGAVQLYDGFDSTSNALAATANSVRLTYEEAETKVPISSFTAAGQLLVGSGPDAFSALPIGAEGEVLTVVGGALDWTTQIGANALLKSGGTMTGDIVFAPTQTFPGVLAEDSIEGEGAIKIGGVSANPIISVDTATATQLGVVQPDNATILVNVDGIISAGTATVAQLGVVRPDNSTILIDAGGIISANKATSTLLGVVQPDNTTITVNGSGVISATSGTLQTVTDAGSLTTNAITVGGLTTTGLATIGGTLQLSDGTSNLVQFSPNGSSYMEGPVGVGVTSDTAFGLTVKGRTAGAIRTFGATASVVVDNIGGANAQLAFRLNGVATSTITDTAGGATTFLTNTASADLILGASNTQYLKISGVDGQITINSSTANSLTLPTSRGASGQVLQSDGAGNTVWATPTSGISSSIFTAAGSLITSSGANNPVQLTAGAAGTILAINAGVPSWRTSTQLGLLTAATAATTYAPLNTPTFTGPATVNANGSPGSNALTVTGGNLILATQYTPSSSSDTGSVGELAWDNTGYLYFCYLPNTWGRVQIDLTPF